MKKTGIFNSEISAIVASMGHMDKIAIVDMGFPIPENNKKIDLVVDKNIPTFNDVSKTVLKELYIEKIIIAEESSEEFIDLIKKICENIEYVSHEELKKLSKESKAIIRTGEIKPYYNAIFISGVIF
ncbi:D-ribose pyranase [Marinitoga lauensis]|uniref:D-ribose pyranase n=1 Tax=Marinitoga lauensis TaxID=2201189 RepID=UPI00101154F4|nr:D-ribose pyranase [Marinitoga lauensis]